MEINPRVFALLSLIGILLFIAFGSGFLFPNKNKVVEPNNSTVVYVEKVITKLVTPTPDGHIYFASEYQNGTRLLKRPFTFIRYNVNIMQNVDGNGENRPDSKDLAVTTIVYDYKFFNKLHWFNPTTYKYQEQLPSEGNKFCFVFIYIYMDDIIGGDARMWLFNRTQYGLFDGTTMYQNIEYPYQIRYRELEQTPTFDGSMYVQAFKQKRLYNPEEYAIKTAGETSEEDYYLRGGQSNNIDGFLLYEIPEDKTENDLIEFADYSAFGFSRWRFAY